MSPLGGHTMTQETANRLPVRLQSSFLGFYQRWSNVSPRVFPQVELLQLQDDLNARFHHT